MKLCKQNSVQLSILLHKHTGQICFLFLVFYHYYNLHALRCFCLMLQVLFISASAPCHIVQITYEHNLRTSYTCSDTERCQENRRRSIHEMRYYIKQFFLRLGQHFVGNNDITAEKYLTCTSNISGRLRLG